MLVAGQTRLRFSATDDTDTEYYSGWWQYSAVDHAKKYRFELIGAFRDYFDISSTFVDAILDLT